MLLPVRTVAPTVLPVSVDEFKSHARIDASDDDALLSALIEAATAHLDGYAGTLGRALISQTWRQDFSAFSNCMRLPVGDLIEIISIAYYDDANATQTLASSVYTTFTDELGPYVALKPNQTWPSAYSRDDAIRVTWTAGYGTSATDVPTAIRHAILLLVTHWYENREASLVAVSAAELPFGANVLLTPFRRVGV